MKNQNIVKLGCLAAAQAIKDWDFNFDCGEKWSYIIDFHYSKLYMVLSHKAEGS